MQACAQIACRTRDDREFGPSRYPYRAGSTVAAFSGGFFEHKAQGLRSGLERHQTMWAIMEYEATFIDSAGYWMASHGTSICLRQKAMNDDKDEDPKLFDV